MDCSSNPQMSSESKHRKGH